MPLNVLGSDKQIFSLKTPHTSFLLCYTNPMNQKERMLAGLAYRADFDGLPEERERAQTICFHYNHTLPREREKRSQLLQELMGKMGQKVIIVPPFRCDYGTNITLGDGVFINYNCTVLDVCPVEIGARTLLGPNVCISAAGHPIHPQTRKSGYEYGAPVKIGADVWIGAHVVVLPGLSIGEGSVIGAGSVVTKDIPNHVIAAGNPCRIIRTITEKDRHFYFKNKKLDVTDY